MGFNMIVIRVLACLAAALAALPSLVFVIYGFQYPSAWGLAMVNLVPVLALSYNVFGDGLMVSPHFEHYQNPPKRVWTAVWLLVAVVGFGTPVAHWLLTHDLLVRLWWATVIYPPSVIVGFLGLERVVWHGQVLSPRAGRRVPAPTHMFD